MQGLGEVLGFIAEYFTFAYKSTKTSMRGKYWDNEELKLVLNLYIKLPFGKIHTSTPEVLEMAKLHSDEPPTRSLYVWPTSPAATPTSKPVVSRECQPGKAVANPYGINTIQILNPSFTKLNSNLPPEEGNYPRYPTRANPLHCKILPI